MYGYINNLTIVVKDFLNTILLIIIKNYIKYK